MAAMNDVPQLDFEHLMDRLRRNIQLKKVQHKQPDAPTGDVQLETDLSVVLSEYDLFATQPRTRGGPLGFALVAVRRVLKVLLAPMLQRQARYNAANARLINDLARQLDEAEDAHLAQSQVSSRLAAGIEELRSSYAALSGEIAGAASRVGQFVEERVARISVASGEAIALVADRIDELSAATGEANRRIEESVGEMSAASAEAKRVIEQQIEGLRTEQTAAREAIHALKDELTSAQAARGEALARLEALAQRERELADRLGAIDREQSAGLQAARERIVEAERKLRRIAFARSSDAGQAADSHAQLPAANGRGGGPRGEPAASNGNSEQADESDYFRFEDRFRGSEQSIKERQRRYIEYFRGHGAVLDFGCGRGEFLELLREAGTDARGVDLNIDMVLLCRDKRLDVIHADGLEFLDRQPDGSLGGIFSAQVIEHLTPEQTTALIRLAYRKLRAGGALVLETLNPESLLVQYRWFWMDMSHKRLVHPATLHFMFESAGFDDVTTRFVEPPEGPLPIPALQLGGYPSEALDRFNRATDYLNRLLYGSSDYAVVGTKQPLG